ncbi:MAG: hypothetical protein WAV15_01035 [Minisyncoccia bacterium]
MKTFTVEKPWGRFDKFTKNTSRQWQKSTISSPIAPGASNPTIIAMNFGEFFLDIRLVPTFRFILR